jgi:ATPase subunit of ABC transporter with duplicated ATPase domains
MRVARFHQHHVDQLDLNVTVMAYMQKVFPDAKEQDVRQHLAKFGLVNRTPYQKIETLSGGQKSRVVFAELVWRRPHLLFLDEPTNHLDLETIESLAAALADFDGGVVLITHNQYLVELACSEIWIVGNNTVTRFEGTFSDYKKLVAKELGFESV